ncbi:MAG: relaxase domain-containing protein [Leptolyngbya sp. SIO3F4]|nr:relaxase domain-containing protein [Leptolyngbya sp. SIO3F4]
MVASISAAKGYDYLVKDYYDNDVDRSGRWLGSGATSFGLTGDVNKKDWGKIWKGYSANGQKLVSNAGAENRVKGHDITLSAPKSVSILFGVGDENLRATIEEAQQKASEDAMRYLEDYASFSRRGYNGQDGESKADIAVGSFIHTTNRLNEVQLHSHNVVFNAGQRTDGTTGALNSPHFYQANKTVGAIYRARLSREMQRAGFEIELTENGGFEIVGVSKEAREAFSSRSKQIDSYLNTHGLKNIPQNREKAAVETRQKKDKLPESQLRLSWLEKAAVYGITPDYLGGMRKEYQELSDIEIWRNRETARETAIEKLLEKESFFTKQTFDMTLAQSSVGLGLTYADIKAEREKFFASNNTVELEGDSNGRQLFTTQTQLDREQRLFEATMSRDADKSHTTHSKHFFEALKERTTISSEQKIALRHVTSAGGVKVVSGMAGTGKSFMLGAAKDVFEKSGYEVQGLALSAKAAKGLEEGSGINSRTIDSFLMSLDTKRQKALENDLKEPELLSNRSVIVLDEAGMVDTKRFLRLFEEANQSGAKLVCVGDSEQLQSVSAGGAFEALRRQVGDVQITEIRRQEEDWAKQVTKDFEAGRAGDAIEALDKRGQFVFISEQAKLKAQLISDWEKGGGVTNAKENLILAHKTKDVAELNRMAQEKRQASGELSDAWGFVSGSKVYEGDRVLFGKNDKKVGVQNGQGGWVTGIDNVRRMFQVRLDNEQEVSFSTTGV